MPFPEYKDGFNPYEYDTFPDEPQEEGETLPLEKKTKPNKELEKRQREEYRTWWKLRNDDPQRTKLKEQWYQKYHNMSPDEYREKKRQAMLNEYHPVGKIKRNFEALSLLGLSYADFGFDAMGSLGLDWLDNWWDEKTRIGNPAYQKIRKFLSVLLPNIQGGKFVAGKLKASQMPRWKKSLVGAGIFSAQEAAIIGLSDVGEEHNALRAISDFIPEVFGPKGSHPIPDWAKTLDTDSPAIRKRKNMYESGGLSIVGTAIGAFMALKGGKKTLDWMNPLDEVATSYKNKELAKAADPEKLIRIQEINGILSTQALDRKTETALINELETLKDALNNIDDLDDAVRLTEDARQLQIDFAAETKIKSKLGTDELTIDPDIVPVFDEAANARQTIPPANVARNIADTTAIKTGISKGDPAPIITESMRKKGLMVGSTSRDAIMGVAEETRDVGRFSALVDGFRFSTKQMNAAAWDIYTSIIAAPTLDDVKNLFLENKDVKNMLMGRFKVEMFNEEQARAAAFAMRDLTDRFLGREVTQSSARVMDTLGREVSTIADSIKELKPMIDDERAMDLIIDKMQFLMDEYALNKYISGWQLRNKNWFDQIPPKELDSVIEQLTQEFKSAENAIHAKNLKFTKTLKELAETNPNAMRPLVDAFAHTNGDVDSITKLYKWTADQISPLGMLKSPNPNEMNLFARSAWGVIYNNVLSGVSAFRAGVGNTTQLILKPITGILGHGIWGFADDWEGLTKTFYYNGAVFETNRRALHDAYQMMKKAHKDPELMMQAYRKDFHFQEDVKWDILEDMRNVWEDNRDHGKLLQYDMAKTMKDMSQMPALRYGMTGMVFSDSFTNTHLAHYYSRVKAYDDVFSEFGFADWDKIHTAEKEHYKNFFDSNGILRDDAVKSAAGEVALNLDDGLANWINQATTSYPVTKFMLMFPRTSSNYIKNSLSWTPISLIPGINKYSKTIWATTDEEIGIALAEHGIEMATTPNAMAIFKNLRAEYTGRLAFSTLLAGNLWQYAMSGNIRGNGHYNASRRNKERNQLGYEPKTINIGGKWVSYKGIIGVEQVLSVVGDLAYYASDLDEYSLENWLSKLSWTLSASFLNETPLQGIEPLIAATNGDLSGWSRLIANSARSIIPMSGAAGVLSNSITSTQKDIQGEVHEYLMNRIPGFSSMLPDQIDIWTGQPLNDIDNPFLRILNAMSPLKVSGTSEPWRKWLLNTGWDGLSRLRRDSTGSYEYSPDEREQIYRFIGEQQLYKQLNRLMKSKRYNKEVTNLYQHRLTGDDLNNEKIRLKSNRLPLFKEIDHIIEKAQIIAEQRLLEERPDITNIIMMQRAADNAMSQGDIEGAANIQRREKQTRELLEMSK